MSALRRAPELLEAALLLLLGTTALYGFRDTYYGWTYLAVGVAGLLLGIALAVLTRRLEQPPVVLLLAVVVVFFVLGGLVALHDLGGSNLLPVPGTIDELAQCAVHGWKQLLTTLPPVDGGPLLALPYLLGLVTGAGGMAATRLRWALAPAMVPIALLTLVILLGVKDPGHTAPVAAVFAVLAIAWMIARERRGRTSAPSSEPRRWGRAILAGGLCVSVAAVALAVGPSLPGLRDQRVVLRNRVVPPFNVGQYASPLASFRQFTKGYGHTPGVPPADALYNKPLLRVTGLPQGTAIRFATLDSYNGIVWGAGNVAGSAVDPSADAADTFAKVGRVIDNPVTGTPVTATVTILDGSDIPGSSALNVWLPTAGDLTGITFAKPDETEGTDDFRYNLASATGVLPEGLAKGDSYTFHAVLPDQRLKPTTPLAAGSLPEVDASTFQQLATTWAGHASDTSAQVRAVAAYLRANGHYTDGEKGYGQYLSGDSLYRLKQFTSSVGQLAGDDEQFAAMMALDANALGVPARVVVGATPRHGDVVMGSDVHAWVELQAADGSWRTLPQSAFMNHHTHPRHQQPVSQDSVPAANIPPPAPVHPPATAGEPLDSSLNHRATAVAKSGPHVPGYVWWILRHVVLPLLLVALIVVSVVGAKRLRRARRRTKGSPVRQLALAWQELLDHVRDNGTSAPATATRREQARAIGHAAPALPSLIASARRVDAVMFGEAPPSSHSVAEYWASIDDLCRQVTASRTRAQRIAAALNIVTFRPRTSAVGRATRA